MIWNPSPESPPAAPELGGPDDDGGPLGGPDDGGGADGGPLGVVLTVISRPVGSRATPQPDAEIRRRAYRAQHHHPSTQCGGTLEFPPMAEAGITATHLVPAGGVDAWTAPDPEKQPENKIEAGQPVEVLEETTGWAHVRCTNGWETWVDASKLEKLSTPGFVPTHRVQASGADARNRPDMSEPVAARLDPGLAVSVINTWGGWTKVKCENEWDAWVDTNEIVSSTAPGSAAAAGAAAPGRVTPLALWLPIGGAAVAILGGFLDWFSPGPAKAWDFGFIGLITHDGADLAKKGFSAGLVLLVCALAAIPLLTGRTLPRLWALAVAGVATNTSLMGVFLILDVGNGAKIGIGMIITLLGGAAMAAGALTLPRKSTSIRG